MIMLFIIYLFWFLCVGCNLLEVKSCDDIDGLDFCVLFKIFFFINKKCCFRWVFFFMFNVFLNFKIY